QTQVKAFAGIHSAWRAVSASVERVAEVLESGPEVTEAPGAIILPPVQGRVAFEKVSFAYESDQPVLREISFEAQPGETIAIVGPTGAGKSTLVSLLPRFFDPQEGR